MRKESVNDFSRTLPTALYAHGVGVGLGRVTGEWLTAVHRASLSSLSVRCEPFDSVLITAPQRPLCLSPGRRPLIGSEIDYGPFMLHNHWREKGKKRQVPLVKDGLVISVNAVLTPLGLQNHNFCEWIYIYVGFSCESLSPKTCVDFGWYRSFIPIFSLAWNWMSPNNGRPLHWRLPFLMDSCVHIVVCYIMQNKQLLLHSHVCLLISFQDTTNRICDEWHQT